MSTTVKPRLAPSLDACVEAELEQWNVPGMAVAVLHEGAIDARGYGVASLETSQPVSVNTLFQIGSITKVFTATLVMRLVESRRLDLDEPVITYLPEVKLADEQARQTITLRHLLSHGSGLYGDYFEDFGWGDDALARSIATFEVLRQITPPGELWHYGNSGFNLAGAVVERVLDKRFEDAMRERIFEPLKMERSFFFAHEAISYPVAVGHTQEPGGEPQIARRYPLPRNVNPAGGIISTVEDLMRFAKMFLGKGRIEGRRILREQTVEAMLEPQIAAGGWAEHYGIGWALRTVDGARVAGHGGSTNGFQAHLALIPEKDFAIAILTNSSRGSAAYRRIEEWAFEYYCGLKSAEPPRVSTTKTALERFEGEYRQPFADITVSAKYNRIALNVVTRSPLSNKQTQLPEISARPIGENRFWVTEGESRGETIEFIPDPHDPDGPPRFIRFHGRLADRVVPEPEPAAGESTAAEAGARSDTEAEMTSEVPAVSTQETIETAAVRPPAEDDGPDSTEPARRENQ